MNANDAVISLSQAQTLFDSAKSRGMNINQVHLLNTACAVVSHVPLPRMLVQLKPCAVNDASVFRRCCQRLRARGVMLNAPPATCSLTLPR
jgi:hypothetical protein